MASERVNAELKRLPATPGVYLFRDENENVLYVGKAKSLRPRVRQYFQAGRSDNRVGMDTLVSRVAQIETIVTGSEVEALHLEQNLVKRHRPPFNVRLRDDKSFPYIAVTLEDEYPRVMFTRKRHRRGVLYFGPYANAKKVRETLDVLNRVFRYRPCEGPKPGRRSGIPCLDYHIERCLAPCVGYVSREAYREVIDGVVEFLSGNDKPIRAELERQMREAAADERFEDAARYRNRLHAVERLAERQAVERASIGTIDVIGLAVGPDRAAVQVFPLRSGRMVDRYSFHLENAAGDDPLEVLEGFCLEYYGAAPSIPPQILVPRGRRRPLDARRASSRSCAGRGSRCVRPSAARSAACRSSRSATPSSRSPRDAGGRDEAAAPRRGARGAAGGAEPRVAADPDRVLRHLQHPGHGDRRLDGGVRGRRRARRRDYRKFAVRGQAGQDDFAAMAEVVSRRFARLAAGPTADEYDESFAATPNLVVIDGGKGQLAAALEAMEAYDLPRVAVVSLAKRVEEVFLPGRPEPVRAARRTRRAPAAPAPPRRGAPLRDHLPPLAPRRGRARVDVRPARGRRAGAPAGAAPPLRLGRAGAARRAEELEGVPGVPAKTARNIYAQLHRAGRGLSRQLDR